MRVHVPHRRAVKGLRFHGVRKKVRTISASGTKTHMAASQCLLSTGPASTLPQVSHGPGEKMHRRELIGLLAAAVVWPLAARAQPTQKDSQSRSALARGELGARNAVLRISTGRFQTA